MTMYPNKPWRKIAEEYSLVLFTVFIYVWEPVASHVNLVTVTNQRWIEKNIKSLPHKWSYYYGQVKYKGHFIRMKFKAFRKAVFTEDTTEAKADFCWKLENLKTSSKLKSLTIIAQLCQIQPSSTTSYLDTSAVDNIIRPKDPTRARENDIVHFWGQLHIVLLRFWHWKFESLFVLIKIFIFHLNGILCTW